MNPFIWLVVTLLNLYFWIILGSVILSWLLAFGIVNTSNQFVRQVAYTLRQLTEPVLGRVRNLLPNLGGIDISPVIVLIAIQFLQYLIVYYVPRLL